MKWGLALLVRMNRGKGQIEAERIKGFAFSMLKNIGMESIRLL